LKLARSWYPANRGSSRRQVWENMTMDDMSKGYGKGLERGTPTPEEGQLVGSWTCAMGSALCDIGCLPQGKQPGIYPQRVVDLQT
jgi:hypothetical protein